MKDTTRAVRSLTLKDIEGFDLDQCTKYIHLIAEKSARWKRLEDALNVRREKVLSEHTSDEDGGWFQSKRHEDYFCRVKGRTKNKWNKQDAFELIRFKKAVATISLDTEDKFAALKPLTGGKPILVEAGVVEGHECYNIQLDYERLEKDSVRDQDTFYDCWEKTTPFILVVKYGADHIELARDYWEAIVRGVEEERNFQVLKYQGTWYIVGRISY